MTGTALTRGRPGGHRPALSTVGPVASRGVVLDRRCSCSPRWTHPTRKSLYPVPGMRPSARSRITTARTSDSSPWRRAHAPSMAAPMRPVAAPSPGGAGHVNRQRPRTTRAKLPSCSLYNLTLSSVHFAALGLFVKIFRTKLVLRYGSAEVDSCSLLLTSARVHGAHPFFTDQSTDPALLTPRDHANTNNPIFDWAPRVEG